jgi:hypothetical protein
MKENLMFFQMAFHLVQNIKKQTSSVTISNVELITMGKKKFNYRLIKDLKMQSFSSSHD